MDHTSAVNKGRGRSSGVEGSGGDGRIVGKDKIHYTTEVLPNDVLCDGRASLHPGNVHYRELISSWAVEYHKGGRKGEIAESIAASLSNKNCRFLRPISSPAEAEQFGVPSGTRAWVLLDQRASTQKIQVGLSHSRGYAKNPGFITELLPYDVVWPNCTTDHQHAGNVHFRAMVVANAVHFRNKAPKKGIVKAIADSMNDNNGRFLREVSTPYEKKQLRVLKGITAWLVVDPITVIHQALQHYLKDKAQNDTSGSHCLLGKSIVPRRDAASAGSVTTHIQTLSPANQPAQQLQSRWGGVDITAALLVELEEYDMFRMSFSVVNKTTRVNRLGLMVITMTPLPPSLSGMFPECMDGVSVYKVWPGTCAEKAGLLVGDMLCFNLKPCRDDEHAATTSTTVATGTLVRGFGSGMRLMTESEFEQGQRRLEKDGFFTFCIVRRRYAHSVANESVQEKHIRDSTCAPGVDMERPRQKHKPTLAESLPKPRPVEGVAGAQSSTGGDAKLPLHDGPADTFRHDGDEMHTDHGAAADVTGGNDGPADFYSEKTANVCGANWDNLDVEQQTPRRKNQEQARLQWSDVASNTKTRNGQESSLTSQEYESAMSKAPPKTTDHLPASNVNQAEAPIFVSADTERSPKKGREAASEGIQHEEGRTEPAMPISAPQGSPAAEDLKQDDDGLDFCLSKMSSIRARNTRLLAKHSDLLNQLESLYTDQTIRCAMPVGFDRKRRKFKIEQIPIPSHCDDEIDMGEHWLRWCACIVIQNARLRSTIVRQEYEIKDLCEYKQLVNQAERAAEELLQRLLQLPTEAEASHEAGVGCLTAK